jgi:CRISPR-associated protein Csm1
VLYTGGGHTYIIAPATEGMSKVVTKFMKELNEWLSDSFDIGLYAAIGRADCSAEDLKNHSAGSYKNIFATISKSISANKLHRYDSDAILRFNNANKDDYSRECVICHRLGELNEDNECHLCASLKDMSDMIINRKDSFFAVMNNDEGVPLPFGYSLKAYSWDNMRKVIADNKDYVRTYSKNTLATGNNMATNLWVGDYSAEKEFSRLIDKSDGIKRLGVIRADVDNLGQAFVSGFSEKENGRYETISRTAVLSRKLSMYFKQYVNVLLKNGKYQLYKDKQTGKRNAVIIYSGGDDLFIVGGWDDILCFAVDLYRSFKRYTQSTLTFSAGIGIYGEKFPISEMAGLTGALEDTAKHYRDTKNAVALFDDNNVYGWEELINKVLGEKLEVIQSYISVNGEHNKALLYNMLELIRDKNESSRLNIARFAYLLARLKPKKDNVSEQEMANYNHFAKSIYSWIQNKEDCKQLTTAIYIFIYMTREREEKENERTE